MGICNTLLLCDEFDWGYVDTNKEKKLEEFSKEFGGCCELIAQWPHYAVFDIDKQSVYSDKNKTVIGKYSDKAYFYMDISVYKLEEID